MQSNARQSSQTTVPSTTWREIIYKVLFTNYNIDAIDFLFVNVTIQNDTTFEFDAVGWATVRASGL